MTYYTHLSHCSQKVDLLINHFRLIFEPDQSLFVLLLPYLSMLSALEFFTIYFWFNLGFLSFFDSVLKEITHFFLISSLMVKITIERCKIKTEFNVYFFPAHASITLTSLTNLGSKKTQSGRQEGYFSSKYFTIKCCYSKKNVFWIVQ